MRFIANTSDIEKYLGVKINEHHPIKNISTDQIEKLAIEDLGAIVGMQAGVVEGHF